MLSNSVISKHYYSLITGFKSDSENLLLLFPRVDYQKPSLELGIKFLHKMIGWSPSVEAVSSTQSYDRRTKHSFVHCSRTVFQICTSGVEETCIPCGQGFFLFFLRFPCELSCFVEESSGLDLK
jgi:hypothetical protein